MNRIAWAAALVFATAASLVLLWYFGIAVLLVLLAAATASAMRPIVARLNQRGFSERAARAGAYSLVVLFIAGFLILFTRPLLEDLQQFADDSVINYERIKMDWPRGGTLFQRALADQLPPTDQFYAAFSGENGITSLLGVLDIAGTALNAVVLAAIVLVLSMYWSANRSRFEHLAFSLLPEEHLDRARGAWSSIDHGVGAYMRGEFAQSVLAGILLGGIYWLIGMPYPVLLAFWVAVVRLIPWFGSILAVLPPLGAAIAGPLLLPIALCVVTLAVLLLIKLTVEQRYFSRKRYSALWTLTAIIALAELWGAPGALLAPTFAVAGQLLAEQLFPRAARLYHPLFIDRIAKLETRLAELNNGGEGIQEETLLQEVNRLRNRVEALAAPGRD